MTKDHVDHQRAIIIFGEVKGMNEAQAKIEFERLLDRGEISFNDAQGFPVSTKEFTKRVKKIKIS